MPNGDVVWYDDSRHAYFDRIEERPGGKWVGPTDARLPSPSTIGKLLETSNEGLLRWAARTTCEGVSELGTRTIEGMAGDAIWDLLNARKLTYRDLRSKRADEGTSVHEKILGCLAAGERIPSLSDVSDEERGYAQGVLAAWHDLEPKPIACEQVVYSSEHRFAGRLDLLCLLDKKRTILDLKTGYVGNGAHTQLAGYIAAAEESGFGPIEHTLILKVTAEGGYDLIPCAAEPEHFVAALTAYRAASTVGKRSRELAKAA
ncbi:MAG: hypothetical protein H0U55_14180 [Rubrobacteraceae bacterium]|nr:hypothetical protein [Rubrobacteraceae bacterium]